MTFLRFNQYVFGGALFSSLSSLSVALSHALMVIAFIVLQHNNEDWYASVVYGTYAFAISLLIFIPVFLLSIFTRKFFKNPMLESYAYTGLALLLGVALVLSDNYGRGFYSATPIYLSPILAWYGSAHAYRKIWFKLDLLRQV